MADEPQLDGGDRATRHASTATMLGDGKRIQRARFCDGGVQRL